jgi:hypothetical protein
MSEELIRKSFALLVSLLDEVLMPRSDLELAILACKDPDVRR